MLGFKNIISNVANYATSSLYTCASYGKASSNAATHTANSLYSGGKAIVDSIVNPVYDGVNYTKSLFSGPSSEHFANVAEYTKGALGSMAAIVVDATKLGIHCAAAAVHLKGAHHTHSLASNAILDWNTAAQAAAFIAKHVAPTAELTDTLTNIAEIGTSVAGLLITHPFLAAGITAAFVIGVPAYMGYCPLGDVIKSTGKLLANIKDVGVNVACAGSEVVSGSAMLAKESATDLKHYIDSFIYAQDGLGKDGGYTNNSLDGVSDFFKDCTNLELAGAALLA